MSGARLLLLFLQKEQSVVIEFPRDLPALLVTLDFYYESTGKKLGSVPVVILGPKTVRAKFPGK